MIMSTLESQYRSGVFSDETLMTPLSLYDVVLCFKIALPTSRKEDAVAFALRNLENTQTLPNFIEKYNKYLNSCRNLDDCLHINGIKCNFADIDTFRDFLSRLRQALFSTIFSKFIKTRDESK